MVRLVHWLARQARSVQTRAFIAGSDLVVRTVETVEIQEATLLVGQRQVGSLDACPLCGSRLVPQQQTIDSRRLS
jgi:hypothetical protein